MPEHRDGTPEDLRVLESFLWHDLDADAWAGWVARKLPNREPGAPGRALRLHAALRAMQAANAGMAATGGDDGAAAAALNRLIGDQGIVPVAGAGGTVALSAAEPGDPVSSLLLDALGAMADGRWRRFKLCGDPGCRASFFDGGKAGTGRWCSMAGCGSRNKMRRFRARTAAGS